MPDHLHLLITPLGITLERAVGMIKGGFSHRLGSKRPVWQNSFQDHRCRDVQDFALHKRYILMNPVRAHLVPSRTCFPSRQRSGLDRASPAKAKKLETEECQG